MNNNRCPFLLDESEYKELCRNFLESRYRFGSPKTKADYENYLRSLRSWMIKNEHPKLDEKTVKAWMLDCTRKTSVDTVQMRVSVVAHFMDYLVSRKLWCENPFSALRIQHSTRGYLGMARILKKTGSIAALDDLADPPFSGALACHFTDYLDHVGALGKSLRPIICHLKSFERYLRQHNIHDLKQIDASVITAWNDQAGRASESQKRHKLVYLKKFFDFLLGQERILVSPIPPIPPYDNRYPAPYVFSREEIRKILAAAEKLPDHLSMPYRGATYRMVFLSLYTFGLRISEALNLKLADIDFVQDSITIGNTKFYKGRVLPFGPRFKSALQRYIKGHPLLIKASPEDFLFPTRNSRTSRLAKASCNHNLNLILKEMSITQAAATSAPNLHSFRHAFAVHRLENWMRDGADIGVKLPLLSAFLGHGDIASTQVYLTMTPERLAMLGERFEKVFGIPSKAEDEGVRS